MVSSYLKRPIRTLEQALTDSIRVRSELRAAASESTAERVHGPRSADASVRVLPAAQARPSTGGRKTLPPRDRRAA